MSDWEEFCEANGWNVGSSEDYDRFLESLERDQGESRNPYAESDSLYFDTYANAVKWAKSNPGRTVRRAENGVGFEAKPLPISNDPSSPRNTVRRNNQNLPDRNHEIWTYSKRCEQIAHFSPQLKDVLTNSASYRGGIRMRPFDRAEWMRELQRLNTNQLEQLRLLLTVHFEDNRQRLKLIESEIRRCRNVKPGNYGEALTEAIQRFVETLQPDIDALLNKK